MEGIGMVKSIVNGFIKEVEKLTGAQFILIGRNEQGKISIIGSMAVGITPKEIFWQKIGNYVVGIDKNIVIDENKVSFSKFEDIKENVDLDLETFRVFVKANENMLKEAVVENLKLSSHAYNALKRAGKNTVLDICQFFIYAMENDYDVGCFHKIGIRNFGAIVEKEILGKLKNNGFLP